MAPMKTLLALLSLTLCLSASAQTQPCGTRHLPTGDAVEADGDAVMTLRSEDIDAMLRALQKQTDGSTRGRVMVLRMKRATAERLAVELRLALGEKPKREATP